MIVFLQSGYNRVKVIVFGQNWVCILGKMVVFGAKVVEFGQSGCIGVKSNFYSGKVVVFGQNLLYSDKVVVFGKKVIVFVAN